MSEEISKDSFEYLKRNLTENQGKGPLEDLWNERAVNCFARAMRDKLKQARIKGRTGWHDNKVLSINNLRNQLYLETQKDKFDYVDIANLAMMLAFRETESQSN